MATRGTYKVENQILYNHWDNYPSGAAAHFVEVIKKCHNLTLFSIIRGMENIKPSGSKFDGPAEYHYEIDNVNKKITCYSIPFDENRLIIHSSGTFVNWINDHIKEQFEPTEDWTVIELHEGYFCTITQAKEDILKVYNRAKDMTNKGHSGNGSGAFCEVFKMINKTKLNFDNIKDEYLRIYSPYFIKAFSHNDGNYFDNLVNYI